MGLSKPYAGRIEDLPVRHQNAYEKRRMENRTTYKLGDEEAAYEARIFIAKRIYLEDTKKAEKALQMSLPVEIIEPWSKRSKKATGIADSQEVGRGK